MIYQNKPLTITRDDLTEKEQKTVDSLVILGDSVELALWTIEHQERKRNSDSEIYRQAYER